MKPVVNSSCCELAFHRTAQEYEKMSLAGISDQHPSERVQINVENKGTRKQNNDPDLIYLLASRCDVTSQRPPGARKDMSHRGEGKAVLVISQFSRNLSVSLNKTKQRRTRSSGKWSMPAPFIFDRTTRQTDPWCHESGRQRPPGRKNRHQDDRADWPQIAASPLTGSTT